MAIITISRGSYSKGKEVAETVAERLGYECISRDVLLDASLHFNIPEVKLIRAIHDAPSVLDRIKHDKRNYIAYIRSELTSCMVKDNIVYHGLAGHLLLSGVPHVLRVRIIANMEDRIKAEMEREHIDRQEAYTLLKKDDRERRKWTKYLYGVDPWDSSLYDVVINIEKLHVSDAVDFICRAAERAPFKATKHSQQKMEDLALACRVKALLVDLAVDIGVTCEYGNVVVHTKTSAWNVSRLKKKIADIRGSIQGINNLEVHDGVPIPRNAI